MFGNIDQKQKQFNLHTLLTYLSAGANITFSQTGNIINISVNAQYLPNVNTITSDNSEQITLKAQNGYTLAQFTASTSYGGPYLSITNDGLTNAQLSMANGSGEGIQFITDAGMVWLIDESVGTNPTLVFVTAAGGVTYLSGNSMSPNSVTFHLPATQGIKGQGIIMTDNSGTMGFTQFLSVGTDPLSYAMCGGF